MQEDMSDDEQKIKRADVPGLFRSLQDQMKAKLGYPISHPTSKGDVSEDCWIEMLSAYLPKRYSVAGGHIVDSNGFQSDQIDIIIFDRQYTPFLLNLYGTCYVPAESVYAVFEVKPELDHEKIDYARDKAESVRILKRTNVPITHAFNAGPERPKKVLFRILAGILTDRSGWSGTLGSAFESAIYGSGLDIGCCLEAGAFVIDDLEEVPLRTSKAKDALIFFFLNLVAKLQALGTVPAIDVLAYERLLEKSE